ncbi:hypothetical protein NL676_008433 [Syzygium grande]|nr:hypothetical protein NL676_008433 [Syzygium grande]
MVGGTSPEDARRAVTRLHTPIWALGAAARDGHANRVKPRVLRIAPRWRRHDVGEALDPLDRIDRIPIPTPPGS